MHNDPSSHGCTVHEYRPRVCRRYDCRHDPRIWTDFENRIPAPPAEQRNPEHEPKSGAAFDLLERARLRALAVHAETTAISDSFADAAPQGGPKPPTRL